jgi:hypothetical protein
MPEVLGLDRDPLFQAVCKHDDARNHDPAAAIHPGIVSSVPGFRGFSLRVGFVAMSSFSSTAFGFALARAVGGLLLLRLTCGRRA